MYPKKVAHPLPKSMETIKGSVATTVIEDDYGVKPAYTASVRYGYGYLSPSMPPQKDHLQDMANAITNKDAQKYAEACAALWKANVS